MNTICLFVCVYLCYAVHSSAHTHEGVRPQLQFQQHVLEMPDFLPAKYLHVIAEETSFPNHPQKQKFEKALDLVSEVLNSQEFRAKVLSYVSPLGKREYGRNFLWGDSSKRLSHEDVYQIIMEGNEKMRANTLGEMNLNVTTRNCKWPERATPWCRSVIGSTSPLSSKWIEINWKFYSQFETHEMVGNLVHEWLHLLGFIHGEENLNEEVPYVVGAIASDVALNLLKEESR